MWAAAQGHQPPNAGTPDPVVIVSSDGHAVARMPDYRPYLPADMREEFDAFCEVHRREGSRTIDPKSLLARMDPYLVDEWTATVIEPGRLAGQSDPAQRLTELDRQGVAAEVLFPDFGLAFELDPPVLAALKGQTRTPEQVEAANRAHNRWLADFVSGAPDRFVGLAIVGFDDVEAAVAEIRWAKSAGLQGIVLPAVDESTPFYHARHEPIWDVLEELGMPANSHTGISAITKAIPGGAVAAAPHPSCAFPILTSQGFFVTREILTHLIWGGVLERHPDLQVVLTEQGSGWVVGALTSMDYSYEGSYLRRDVREVVRHKPSEYFGRQCHLGSSLFSLAEAQARSEIGVDKIAIGVDYPHHEGTWGSGPGNVAYLRATLGAAGVSAEEARLMLGGNAAALWKLDADALESRARLIGPSLQEILTPPTHDYFPRGDVRKPLATGV